LLNSILNKFSNKVAIHDDKGVELTYSDLFIQSNLLNKHIKKRSLIFNFCENTLGALIGYYSFLDGGHVQLLLDSTLDINKAKKLISVYKPNIIWVPNFLLDKFNDCLVIFSNWNYSLIVVNESKVIMHKDLSLLLTTSGSTGSPKLVRLSQVNLFNNAKSIAKYLNINYLERPITSLPMHYSYGLSVINSHLIKGATIFLTNYSVVQKEFWDFAKKFKITSISGVPYTYQLLKMLRFSTMELPDLKTLTQAGGKLSSNLIEEFANYAVKSGKEFIVMYGQTEATARMSYLPSINIKEKTESVGIAIPGGKFSLIDLHSKEFINECNIQGELIFNGANVSLGYANNYLDLSKGDENLGVLRTGDVAYRDKDGFYYITGRIKRFIKIFGNRVNLDEVEQLLQSFNIECACDGIDDKLFIYTINKNSSLEIIELLVSKLKFNFRAFEIRYVSEIPKSSSGKVLYSQLNNIE
jgi:long-chain acyl-CoA synthetase